MEPPSLPVRAADDARDERPCAMRTVLTYIKTAVTRNYSEKVINKILDLVSASQQMDLLQEFYETTLTALQVARAPHRIHDPSSSEASASQGSAASLQRHAAHRPPAASCGSYLLPNWSRHRCQCSLVAPVRTRRRPRTTGYGLRPT